MSQDNAAQTLVNLNYTNNNFQPIQEYDLLYVTDEKLCTKNYPFNFEASKSCGIRKPEAKVVESFEDDLDDIEHFEDDDLDDIEHFEDDDLDDIEHFEDDDLDDIDHMDIHYI